MRAIVSPLAAVLVLGATVLLVPPMPSTAGSVTGLRREHAALAARERAALLDLYALDTHLATLRSQVFALRSESAELERERAAARARLRVARQTLRRAVETLGRELRALYEQSQPDPLAIVLGATSLRGALEGLESLRSEATATTAVVVQTQAARLDVARLVRGLGDRARELRALEQEAAAKAAALIQARAERAGYVERLRDRQRLNAEQIATLELRARAAQAKARAATLEATAASSIASFAARAPLETPPAAPVRPRRRTIPASTVPVAAGETELTAAPAEPAVPPPPLAAGDRTIVVISTGYSMPGTTATGLPVGYGVVAVDPTVIPLGTRMTIPAYGEAIAADTGAAITGVRVDLWFPTQKEALAWGWRTLTITLH